MRASALEVTFIATRAELAAAVARWRGAAELALDTEFVFERTFRPRPGLVQVATASEVALIDAVALSDLTALGPLLADAAIVKHVHAGAADVELLRRLSGAAPRTIFDTQIAAAFAGLGIGLSYATVVRMTQGVELAKSETRTDWTRRPLAESQLRYAAEDVRHLLPAARELRRRLASLGRLEWAVEEAAELHEEEEAEPDAGSAGRRLRGVDRLPPAARAVAGALSAWRERTAERLDLARPFLMRDETLLALARRSRVEREDLRRLPGFDAGRHLRHAEAWLEAHAEAVAAAASASPEAEPARPSRAERERLASRARRLAETVAEAAASAGLPTELLLSRRRQQALLAAIDRGERVGEALTGFRRELLGAPLRWLEERAEP